MNRPSARSRSAAKLALTAAVFVMAAGCVSSDCGRLAAALEARRVRCADPPLEPIDCSAGTVASPGESLEACLEALETSRCDEPISAFCVGQLLSP